MASPREIRELRYLSGTTFNGNTYVAADAAGWAPGTATKLRATAFDHSGLEHAAEADPTLKQRVFERPFNIPTTKGGSFSFSTYLGAAESDEAANPVATLMSKIMGGLSSPAARTYAVSDASGTSTTIKIYAVGIEAEAVGNAVLISGEAREILATGTNYIDINMALSGVPANAVTIVVSTTAYLDEDSTQEYLDFLAIGHATDDQWQMNSCQATALELAGTGAGELPMINYTMTPADWQVVASGDRDQLEPTSASQGNAPPVNVGLGALHIQDTGTTTRTVFKGGNFSMPNLGVSYQPVPDINGPNRIGGWQKIPPGDGLSATVSLLYDEDQPGLYADFTAPGTAKQVLMQFGSTAQKCAAISLPRCYVATNPKPTDLDGLSAVEVTFTADESAITTNDLTYSAVRIHWF